MDRVVVLGPRFSFFFVLRRAVFFVVALGPCNGQYTKWATILSLVFLILVSWDLYLDDFLLKSWNCT